MNRGNTLSKNNVVLARGLLVTVIRKLPVGVVAATLMVSVTPQVELFAPTEQEVGEKLAVAPAGSPDTEGLPLVAVPKETVPLKPDWRVAVTVTDPAVPCVSPNPESTALFVSV